MVGKGSLTGTKTAMDMTIEPTHLLLLLNWMSPAFPTGAFAYSHGLEWAIGSGDVHDVETVFDWTDDLLTIGSGFQDAVLISNCHPETLKEMNTLALALCASRERYLESISLGQNFVAAAKVFVPFEKPGDETAYPVAVAAAGLAAGISLQPLLIAYLQGLAASLVSVAVRLIPLGQTAGLGVLHRLMPVIERTAARAGTSTLDALGSATLHSDIASMNHEFQQPRIFRT